jgi:xylose isomerase
MMTPENNFLSEPSFHSICRWTFNSGKGGFVPSNIRPSWGKKFNTSDIILLISEKIKPRLPKNIVLGIEMHYDNEINEESVEEINRTLKQNGIYLAMITPGAHTHFAYGGISSLDDEERINASEFGKKTVNVAYQLKETWNKEVSPSLVLWNGSWGYDLATPLIKSMRELLKKGVADLCKYEKELGGELYLSIEPKPNEGHPKMLIPTVASALIFWNELKKEYNVDLNKVGVNLELGHSEMIGLDPINDISEEISNNALVHLHLNSQGMDDGITLGGPGMYDVDHGFKISGQGIALARIISDANYSRWKGHDMQPRPYDNEEQAIERVIRSILSWEACVKAGKGLDLQKMKEYLIKRDTAKVEDMMGSSMIKARKYFDEMYSESLLKKEKL